MDQTGPISQSAPEPLSHSTFHWLRSQWCFILPIFFLGKIAFFPFPSFLDYAPQQTKRVFP